MQNSNSKKLNVLFLCSWYPNRDNPTLGNFVQKHAEAANRENNITILSIISSPNVKSTEFISKDEAAIRLKEDLGEDFVEFLGYNPLLLLSFFKRNRKAV